MCLEHNFFCVQPSKKPIAKNAPVSQNTVEQRRKREGKKDKELGVNYIYYSNWLFISGLQ
jgi:hypothetical protein